MKRFMLLSITVFFPLLACAQEVRNTSYITSTGERVLRLEMVIPVNKQEAWQLVATADGWKRWAAPVVSVDFRVGGAILTNYDENKTTADSGTIRLPILSYLEGEMVILRVILNNSFSQSVRKQNKDLQEIIQIVDAGDGKTRIVSSMIGWGSGPEWDKTYQFFARGNKWSYEQMAKLFY
jgi:uncharacterized protein YndB with AHSA1/START domain